MIRIASIFCFIFLPLFNVAQLISLSTGFYDQKSTTIEEMQNQVDGNEEDSFFHLDVDNIYKHRGFEFGASYSYMATGISIFVEDTNLGVAGMGTVESRSHRIGLKLSYPLEFWKIFKFSPYILTSYEIAMPSMWNSTISYGQLNTNKFPNFTVTTNSYEVNQFVPSLGAQMNIRAFRKFNLVFNLQYSFGSKVTADLEARYRYFEDFRKATIQNTNTGIMMGFGIGHDLDYVHNKKPKNE